jgi:hypothetical protein
MVVLLSIRNLSCIVVNCIRMPSAVSRQRYRATESQTIGSPFYKSSAYDGEPRFPRYSEKTEVKLNSRRYTLSRRHVLNRKTKP